MIQPSYRVERLGVFVRRLIAFVLLCAFMLQSTGSAVAAPPTGGWTVPSLPTTLARQVFGAITATELFAVMTNNISGYSLIHAPAPDFSRIPRAELVTPQKTRTIQHVAARFVGTGTRVPALPRPSRFGVQVGSDPLSVRSQAANARKLQAPVSKR